MPPSSVLPHLRAALRSLARARGFTVAVVLTLGLALGATTAMFSIVDGVLLRALPVAAPDRLVALVPLTAGVPMGGSPALFAAWAEQSREFAAVAATLNRDATLLLPPPEPDDPAQAGTGVATAAPADARSAGTPAEPGAVAERFAGLAVSARYAEVLGVAPALGRTLGPADDVPGAPPVVVVGHRLWRTRLGGDPHVLGRTLRLDGVPHTVVGVLPPSLDPLPEAGAFWVPLALDPGQRANYTPYLTILGRLRPGVERAAAARELDVIVGRLGPAALDDGVRRTVRVTPALRELTEPVRRPLLLMLGAVAAVLLIGCANVSTLVLARSVGRARELAVRAALGAGRARLVRELAAEHLVLGLLAAALAVPTAWALVQAFVRTVPAELPRVGELRATGVDARALAFALVVGVGCALSCGLVAAWYHGRLDVRRALQGGGERGSTARGGARWRRLLVGAEVALALVLLTGAGLFLRSARALGRVSPGYDAAGVLTARLALPERDYPEVPRAVAGFEAILEAARRQPGVGSAALVSRVPLGGSATSVDVAPADRPDGALARTNAALRLASPGYFRTLRIPLLAGRDLRPDDGAGAPAVVVVNATLARRLAAGAPLASVVGRSIASDNGAFADAAGRPRPMTVVGVVGDLRDGGPREAVAPEFYAPLGQVSAEPWNYWIARELLLVASPAGGPTDAAPATAATRALALAPALRRAVATVDARVPLYDVRTTGTRLAEAQALERLSLRLLVAVGVVALLLTAVGIQGVVTYDVRQRTREVGIRLALGASPGQAVRLLVGQGMRPVLVGALAGGVAAVGAARLAGALLFGVSPLDAVSLVGAGLLLGAVALASCWAPARGLAAVDPALPLRVE